MTQTLADIASVVRSKNSGPFEITLDIIFKSRKLYKKALASECLSEAAIAKLYHLDPGTPVRMISFDTAWAIKFTFPRRIAAGALGDTDLYGAQQHAPLLGLIIEGATTNG